MSGSIPECPEHPKHRLQYWATRHGYLQLARRAAPEQEALFLGFHPGTHHFSPQNLVFDPPLTQIRPPNLFIS